MCFSAPDRVGRLRRLWIWGSLKAEEGYNTGVNNSKCKSGSYLASTGPPSNRRCQVGPARRRHAHSLEAGDTPIALNLYSTSPTCAFRSCTPGMTPGRPCDSTLPARQPTRHQSARWFFITGASQSAAALSLVCGGLLELRCRARPRLPSPTLPAQHQLPHVNR